MTHSHLPTQALIRPNAYYDSVTLMAISQQVAAVPGVSQCVAVMGTDLNKQLLSGVGLLTPEAAAAGPGDLVIAAAADSEAALAAALAQVEARLQRHFEPVGGGAAGATGGAAGGAPPATIRSAVRRVPGANLALISVPGPYAALQARLALESGLHVMLYSDNVPVADEVALKRLALSEGRLLMGPDCGTAIINGTGLGFANAVRRGNIGIVAASGTGAQELSSLIDRLGGGISQLVGTGGRDLSADVGGLMTLQAIDWLAADPQTAVLAVISKPPAPAVAAAVRQRLAQAGKPAVLCLLDGALSIDAAAAEAVSLAGGGATGALLARLAAPPPTPPVSGGRRFVRGLFSGGTLCEQALRVLEAQAGPVLCNVHPDPQRRGGAQRSTGHTLVDLGDDEFTRGRPHPMIDPSLRRQRLLAEAADPATAVILLDVVLGYGSHADPAGALAEAIGLAVGLGVAVVASVTGTAGDPQGYERQVAALQGAGAAVAATARLAAELTAACLR